nr:MAG TPA: hypothetical protein [Caudoviricetes sp.]
MPPLRRNRKSEGLIYGRRESGPVSSLPSCITC